jgi:chromosome segregation ATPase
MLIVLSAKLFNVFKSELAELQDRIDALKEYDKTLWEEMKTFWDKVQTSQTEKHISREHANMLRDQTNELFAQLKKLRSAEDEVFEAEAKNNFERLDQELQRIKNAFASAHPELNNLFNALKELQREFRNARLTRGMRTQLWEGIDQAFKDIKEKRFPSNAAAPSHNANNDTRLQRRIEGLKEAVQRMEESIQRDDKELQIQNQKMDSSTANQLEVQLREVRAKLIRERIESKNTKLSDMKKTLHDLEEKLKKAAAKQQPPQEEEKAANEEPQD